MATKIALKAKEAFVQYSKRMCTAVAVFWMGYRILITLLIFFRSDVATAYIQLTQGVDTVMIANISVYTTNSVVEKTLIAFGKNKLKNTDDEKETEGELTITEEKDGETDNNG